MAYGTAPTSGGTGDAVTTDSITTIDGGAGSGEAQIIKVAYGSVGDANVVSASQPFPTSLSTTPFVPVAGNSSSANIASGAAFTGTISANPSQASISINVISDQPVQIKLRQFTDASGLNAVPEVSCPAVYTNGFYACNVCVPANSNYWQIYALNIGSATTTKFVVDCGTGWLWPVTAQGNLPASINEIGGTAVSGSLPVTVNVPTAGLTVSDPVFVGTQTNSGATSVFISGDPNGPLAGVNLLEEAFQGNFQLSVNTPDLPKGGANAGLLLADGAQSFYTATTGSALGLGVIDTTGYGSLIVSGYAGGGTAQVFFSDNGRDWNTIFGTRNYNGGSTDSAASFIFTTALPGTLVYPVCGRYAQVRITAVSTAPATVSVVLKYASAPQSPLAYSTASGSLNTVIQSITAGSNAIGDVGIQYRASATGAATISKFTAAATTNAASIKASAGRLIGWSLVNTTAAIKVFRFFNKASAPTVGTDSPAFVVYLAANGRSDIAYDGGLSFATGIAIACTGAIGDLDATATAANDVLGAIFYA